MPLSTEEITQVVRAKAGELGFDQCGFAPAEKLTEDLEHLKRWTDKGFHGDMQYMENRQDVRSDPHLLLPDARSVIATLMYYYPGKVEYQNQCRIAKYTLGLDYHDVIGKRLRSLQDFIQSIHPGSQCKSCVDSSSIFEKRWAQRAGLGWIGKNCLLVSPISGSFHLIGLIVTDTVFHYDAPHQGSCGKCTKCIDACPGNALSEEGSLDARRCISYLTNTYKGEHDNQSLDFKEYIFGCDECQDVCPHNSTLKVTQHPEFMGREEIWSKKAEDWLNMSTEEYNDLTIGTCLRHKGRERMLRNLRYNLKSE